MRNNGTGISLRIFEMTGEVEPHFLMLIVYCTSFVHFLFIVFVQFVSYLYFPCLFVRTFYLLRSVSMCLLYTADIFSQSVMCFSVTFYPPEVFHFYVIPLVHFPLLCVPNFTFCLKKYLSEIIQSSTIILPCFSYTPWWCWTFINFNNPLFITDAMSGQLI